MLAKTEAVLNSRLLVYVDNNIHSGHPLTPGHFLSPNSKAGIPTIYEIPYDGDVATKVVKS